LSNGFQVRYWIFIVGFVSLGQRQVEVNEYDDPFGGSGFTVIGTLWVWDPDVGATAIATPPHRVQPETV
jgi:hypothetical protein